MDLVRSQKTLLRTPPTWRRGFFHTGSDPYEGNRKGALLSRSVEVILRRRRYRREKKFQTNDSTYAEALLEIFTGKGLKELL